MDELIKYLSLITLCGTGISFIIGLLKWIDQRNREQEQKHFEAFHKMICIASGVDESGKTVKMVQQVAAIYQLRASTKYAYASIPVLQLMEVEQYNRQDPRIEHLSMAITKTIDHLEKYRKISGNC